MLARSLSENASEFGIARFALSLPSARPGGASEAAVVGAACIAVVAAVAGAAVVAGIFDAMGFACATLAQDVYRRWCCWWLLVLLLAGCCCKSAMVENVEMFCGCINHFKTHAGSVDLTSALCAPSRMSSPLWNCCSQKWLTHWFSSRAASQLPAFFRFHRRIVCSPWRTPLQVG